MRANIDVVAILKNNKIEFTIKNQKTQSKEAQRKLELKV